MTRFFYISYILYRGLKHDLGILLAELKVLFDIILSVVVIRIPLFNLLVFLITYIFRLPMEYLSSIDLSAILRTVSINCQGAQVIISIIANYLLY